MTKAIQKMRERNLAHPRNHREVEIRLTKLREIWGAYDDDKTMRQAVNDYMVSLGYPEISQCTFFRDKQRVGEEFNQVFEEHRHVVAAENFHRLGLLKKMHFEDYLKKREEDGNVAPIVDNLRKLELTEMQLTGVIVQKHEYTGDMTVMAQIQAVLETPPQAEPKVIPLLEDGEFAVLPNPSGRTDG